MTTESDKNSNNLEELEVMVDTPKKSSLTDYEHLLEFHLDKIKTLDLIGFQGSEFVSSLISHLQSKALLEKNVKIDFTISHVGLAIRGVDLNRFNKSTLKFLENHINDSDIYIFESTASGSIVDNVRDVLGKYFFGAQIRPLRDVILNYSGKIYWSKSNFHLNRFQLKNLAKFIKDYNYRPYERSPTVMLANFFFCKSTESTPDSVFCSELVARCLIQLGLIDDSVNPEKVVPMDFYQDPKDPTKTLDIDGVVPVLYNELIRLK